MNPNKSIKVIKNTQRATKPDLAQSNLQKDSGVRKTNRDIAGNVAEWIREFQQNRHAQSGRTFASLFVEPVAPLGRLS